MTPPPIGSSYGFWSSAGGPIIAGVIGGVAVIVVALITRRDLNPAPIFSPQPVVTTTITTTELMPTTITITETQTDGVTVSPSPSNPVLDTNVDTTANSEERVSLIDLCKNPNARNRYCGESYIGTQVVGAKVFDRVAQSFSGQYESVLIYPPNKCTQLVVNFAIADSDGNATATASVQVVQESMEPQESSIGKGQVGTLTANLDGGTFYLQSKASATLSLNGYAVCD